MKPLSLLVFLVLALPAASADPVASPTPPLMLTATQTDGGVHLDWTAPAGPAPVDGYRIYRSDGGPFTHVGTTTETEYVDAGGTLSLKPDEGMSYYVTAVNEAGESPPSNAATGNYPYCWTVIREPYPWDPPPPHPIPPLPLVPAMECFSPLPFTGSLDGFVCKELKLDRPMMLRIAPC